MVERLFPKNEIKLAVLSLNTNGSPCLDGFSTLFLKNFGIL